MSRGFDENDLYDNLGWLKEHQERKELSLFKTRQKEKEKQRDLFLYDVTSSYFEGMCNALADWGYNRDGKKGKKQVVVGMVGDCGMIKSAQIEQLKEREAFYYITALTKPQIETLILRALCSCRGLMRKSAKSRAMAFAMCCGAILSALTI
jgi:hypothetical protein